MVLRRMHELGMLDERRLAQATQERLVVQRGTAIGALGPYFADWVRGQVEQLQPADDVSSGGLRIYTTLQPVLQRAAEAALARGLDRLEGQYRPPAEGTRDAAPGGDRGARPPHRGDPRDGRGARLRAEPVQPRHAGAAAARLGLQAVRVPGGPGSRASRGAANFTPASLLEDRPLTIGTGRNAWTPRNYENRYEGTVTVRRALEQSLNAATVWMAEAIGYDAVVRTAREAGSRARSSPCRRSSSAASR